MALITGNTYPVKDRLKALGGRWDADARGWDIPADKADEARTIVASAGPAKPRSGTGNQRRTGRCADCGAASGRYYRCYDCSLEHRDGGSRHMGGQSYRDSHGNFVLGDDD